MTIGMSGYLNKADREADMRITGAVQAGAEAIVQFMLKPEAAGMPAAAMSVHLSQAVVAAALPYLTKLPTG